MKVIIGGRKNYKPDRQTIANAIARKIYDPIFLQCETVGEYSVMYREDFLKLLYLEIRFCSKMNRFKESRTEESVTANFTFVEHILEMLRFITPRELLQIFPPE